MFDSGNRSVINFSLSSEIGNRRNNGRIYRNRIVKNLNTPACVIFGRTSAARTSTYLADRMNVDIEIGNCSIGRKTEEYVIVCIVSQRIYVVADFEILRSRYGIVDVDRNGTVSNVFYISYCSIVVGRSRLNIAATYSNMVASALLELYLTVVCNVQSTADFL